MLCNKIKQTIPKNMFDHVHVTQTGVCLYKILNKSIAISSTLQPSLNDVHTKMKASTLHGIKWI